jgi:hypothetical protein
MEYVIDPVDAEAQLDEAGTVPLMVNVKMILLMLDNGTILKFEMENPLDTVVVAGVIVTAIGLESVT